MRHVIRKLTSDDVPAAVQLCRQAGWNQLEADWRRLIEHEPQGCFGVNVGMSLAGTVTTTRYGADMAWIGMMLVASEHRRNGFATSLMRYAIDYLLSHNTQCIRLDATPAGKAVYGRLGFHSERIFSRWSRPTHQSQQEHLANRHDVLDQSILAIDRDAFGADRRDWLQRLAAESQVIAEQDGYGMLRLGYLADYLGPIVATNSDAATRIARELLNRSTAKQVFWDAFDPIAERQAKSLGFKPVRELVRMWMGNRSSNKSDGIQYAIGDPGTG